MRYFTRDIYKRMQFFGIAHENIDLDTLHKEWTDSEHPLDVYEIFYREVEYQKEDMLRLLPKALKDKIYNFDSSIKKDALNEDLYRELVEYRRSFSKDWEEACEIVWSQRKKLQKKMPVSIKKLDKLSMHDEKVTSIYSGGENTVVVELEERTWGRPQLIFKGVEKADILVDRYPTWWLYEELFSADNGTYELNALFEEGEISIIFSDFEIKVQTKKYLAEVIEECSPHRIKARIDENIKISLEDGGNPPCEEAISNMIKMLSSDEEIFNKVSGNIGHKQHFAGRKSLSRAEKDISLFSEFITNLIYSTVSRKHGFKNGGFENIKAFSKSKLNRILELLNETGPKYLYKITLEAKNIFEEVMNEEREEKINKLNSRMIHRYLSTNGKRDEIFTCFVNYIKANRDKF
jgi:hypothetical protein